MPKVTDHELAKLRAKASLSRITKLKSLQDVMRDADHLATLILKRHGYSSKTHAIDFRDGSIIEKVPEGEDRVVQEVDSM